MIAPAIKKSKEISLLYSDHSVHLGIQAADSYLLAICK
ncbi:hypothetical protein QY97_02327 [Bacillus thermotolerans]|uniref:Uncharacterized protein n=1 Tax=Bacillus thermotolerans TaxID=1221996 RepID=A0A0F5HYW0_BACTR|nr:hypothetical protein QY95_02711 [Bacillus thermotolerans]KKB38418.1 hypothetical protein QY97_02327 [Bacillus thermotolerans]